MFRKIEVEIDIPDGWEFVRYGVPEVGESYLGVSHRHVYLREPDSPVSSKYFIVKKVKQYREPVLPADCGKECEFSDDGVNWAVGILQGYVKYAAEDDIPWKTRGHSYGKYCRIACDE